MLTIDGSFGEGGGQILRTSLTLSLLTGKPFILHHIRSNRRKPGLRKQHLTCVQAAAKVGNAAVVGAELNSQTITFEPGEIQAGSYRFSIGTAGSTMLLFQTLLPVLLQTELPSHLELEGGTHNGMAPSFEFIERTFLPVINQMGVQVDLELKRPGFYPKGGGLVSAKITPTSRLTRWKLLKRDSVLRKEGFALVSQLPKHIANRELKKLGRELRLESAQLHLIEESRAIGAGNVCWVEIETDTLTEVFSRPGELGVSAESIAGSVAREVKQWLKAEVPVGEHLADQLLIPLAIGSGGSYLTTTPSEHTRTNIAVIQQFLNVEIEIEQLTDPTWKICVEPEGQSKKRTGREE